MTKTLSLKLGPKYFQVGAATFTITTFSIMALSITIKNTTISKNGISITVSGAFNDMSLC
jgi:hypothetical protein